MHKKECKKQLPVEQQPNINTYEKETWQKERQKEAGMG